MPTVGDLIHSLDKEAVFAHLARLYQGDGESPEGYNNVWHFLKNLQPKMSDTSILISRRWSLDDPPEPRIDVSGTKGGSSEHWAIEYVEWQEWLWMPILVDKEIQPMADEEALAHCMYEMTWAGYTQSDIKEQYDEIIDRVDEVRESLKPDLH